MPHPAAGGDVAPAALVHLDVSHELRTPLTTVRMAADLIFNTQEFDPAGAQCELFRAELDRFENLLSSCRDQPVRRRLCRA